MLKLHQGHAAESRRLRACLVKGESGLEGFETVLRDPRLRVEERSSLKELLSDSSGEDAPPELILIGQTWSDQFTSSDVLRLLDRFPLARILCVYGPLCESDGRTRDVWPLSLRIPARKLPVRLELEMQVLRGRRVPLPRTATREEIIRFEQEGASNVSETLPIPRQCLIHSPDRVWAETLAGLLPQSLASDAKLTTRMHEFHLQLKRQRDPLLLLLDIDPAPDYFLSWLNQQIPPDTADSIYLITNTAGQESEITQQAKFPCRIRVRAEMPETCQTEFGTPAPEI